jgi:hypothetical protein
VLGRDLPGAVRIEVNHCVELSCLLGPLQSALDQVDRIDCTTSDGRGELLDIHRKYQSTSTVELPRAVRTE